MSSEQRSRLAIENRVANWRSYGVRSPVALGMPEIRQLETTSLCNLRCVFCPYEQMTRSKHNMDLEVFTEFLNRDELSHVSEIALHHFGEPLLQANFAQYVSVATKLGIDTVVSSNLNKFSQDQCFEVLRAGLTRIIVSIDAVRPETYRALRLRGNLDKVEQNLRGSSTLSVVLGVHAAIGRGA